MSYSQLGRDDIFLYTSPKGLVCANCYFQDGYEMHYRAESTQEMIDHIKTHENIGHRLPPNIYQQLLDDDLRNYPSADNNGTGV